MTDFFPVDFSVSSFKMLLVGVSPFPNRMDCDNFIIAKPGLVCRWFSASTDSLKLLRLELLCGICNFQFPVNHKRVKKPQQFVKTYLWFLFWSFNFYVLAVINQIIFRLIALFSSCFNQVLQPRSSSRFIYSNLCRFFNDFLHRLQFDPVVLLKATQIVVSLFQILNLQNISRYGINTLQQDCSSCSRSSTNRTIVQTGA